MSIQAFYCPKFYQKKNWEIIWTRGFTKILLEIEKLDIVHNENICHF